MCTPNEYRRMVLRLHLYLCKGCLNSQFTKYLPPLSKVYISVYNSLVIEIDLPVKDAALICLAVFLFPRSDIAAIRPPASGAATAASDLPKGHRLFSPRICATSLWPRGRCGELAAGAQKIGSIDSPAIRELAVTWGQRKR